MTKVCIRVYICNSPRRIVFLPSSLPPIITAKNFCLSIYDKIMIQKLAVKFLEIIGSKIKRTAATLSLAGFYINGSFSSGRGTDTTNVPTQVERCMGAGLDLVPISLLGSGSEACFCRLILSQY